jgi:hypothetical protein
MNMQGNLRDPAARAVLGLRGDTPQRLVVDMADLVDWAAEATPKIARLRDAVRGEQLVALGFAALTAAAVTLLVAWHHGSRS